MAHAWFDFLPWSIVLLSFNWAPLAASESFINTMKACGASLAASFCSISHISTSTPAIVQRVPENDVTQAAAPRWADRRTRRMETAAKWEDFKYVADLQRVKVLLPKCPKNKFLVRNCAEGCRKSKKTLILMRVQKHSKVKSLFLIIFCQKSLFLHCVMTFCHIAVLLQSSSWKGQDWRDLCRNWTVSVRDCVWQRRKMRIE